MSDTVSMAMSEPARRMEIFTGAGGRRSWSDEQKAAIAAESMSGRESVSAVARRHGLLPLPRRGHHPNRRRPSPESSR
jgi:transposase